MAKKKTKETFLTKTPQEIHQQLNACINCILEKECENVKPFPINLTECCDKYVKTIFQ